MAKADHSSLHPQAHGQAEVHPVNEWGPSLNWLTEELGNNSRCANPETVPSNHMPGSAWGSLSISTEPLRAPDTQGKKPGSEFVALPQWLEYCQLSCHDRNTNNDDLKSRDISLLGGSEG